MLIDEKTKELIGDIAPKKLANGVDQTAISSNDSSKTSAWNSAGIRVYLK